MFINQLDEGLHHFFSLHVYGSVPAFFPKVTGPKDDPNNDTLFVAALPEIQSILLDAST